MMGRPGRLAIMSALAVLAAGCASDPTHYFTLTPTATRTTSASKLSVAVGPVSVPATVDRAQIVVSSSGSNQLTFDEFNRWASPLQDNLAHVVAEDLVALLGTPRITLFPQTLSSDMDYRVEIEVRNFESSPGHFAALDAVWTVRRAKDGKSQTGRTSVREPLQDSGYDALAAAHSRAIAAMSKDIANAILALDHTAS
jgi:uncharacterized lipoprotein YmbA